MFSKEELRVIKMALDNWDGWDSEAKKTAFEEHLDAYDLSIKIHKMLKA